MISRFERNKDSVQDAVESTANHVGRIATIITTAIVDITREIGEMITDGIEMREASKKAEADGGRFTHHRDELDDDLPEPDDDSDDPDDEIAARRDDREELESADRPALPKSPDTALPSRP
ncbi:hypothetical protein [Williamsia sterculiae]|uniref:Uncharacterized protein n=1 Tax=Williamsia sterculiae TaxID=1344003 RepID=A0A1N7DQ91_9NOCA|nr:hypothetical protein [Williamsia sterculiae]SIR78026.1 hypothetical protein SAMN05445060_0824 [Williamsia sterculiae]